MEVMISGWRDDSVIVDGTVWNNGKVAVVVRRCLAAFVPLDEFYYADDLRVLYSEIFRPMPESESAELFPTSS
jgi:hypothetical protein